MWSTARPQAVGDLSMRYLQERVPGLTAGPSSSLRLGMLEYRHEGKVLGEWPGILARFELPDVCTGASGAGSRVTGLLIHVDTSNVKSNCRRRTGRAYVPVHIGKCRQGCCECTGA